LRARSNELILAIENIRTFVAFHEIACNEQEMLPRVLRAQRENNAALNNAG
jgi:hypothetical protein